MRYGESTNAVGATMQNSMQEGERNEILSNKLKSEIINDAREGTEGIAASDLSVPLI